MEYWQSAADSQDITINGLTSSRLLRYFAGHDGGREEEQMFTTRQQLFRVKPSVNDIFEIST